MRPAPQHLHAMTLCFVLVVTLQRLHLTVTVEAIIDGLAAFDVQL